MIYALGDLEPTIDPTAYVHPDAVLIGEVELGPEASVWPGAVLRADNAVIRVGARTSIQDGSVLHVAPGFPTVVGTDCVIGHLVHMEGCTIEDRCLVGMGAILLNGVTVGSGSIVAAGTLLPEGTQVPPRSLVMGSPGKVRRTLSDADLDEIQMYADRYVGYRLDYQ